MTLVSENIRYLRKLNGLTQEQFSRKINIKRSLLGAYEEGRANPNQQNIQVIAKAFNTTVELLTRQDLRKLRETPSLSIPLGQPGATPDTRPGGIRSDGKLSPDDDDPFQHPDFPDIFAPAGFAQPSPARTPEPKPLATVLNTFYKPDEARPGEARPGEARPAPVAPVITNPVRPTAERIQPPSPGGPLPGGPSPGGPVFQPVSPASPVDRLFGTAAERSPVAHPTPAAPEMKPPAVVAHEPVLRPSRSIPVVLQHQFSDYSQHHQQADFLNRLPPMHLPTLPEGEYRAFEAGDDFTFPGALLVGQLVRNWFDIADGKIYVLLVQGMGICCRRVYNQVKVKSSLLLTADRPHIPNREVPLKDVLEVWDVRAFVSQQLPPPAPNTDRLRQLVDELRFEVERL